VKIILLKTYEKELRFNNRLFVYRSQNIFNWRTSRKKISSQNNFIFYVYIIRFWLTSHKKVLRNIIL